MARPRKDQDERRTRVLGVRLTPTERAALGAAAAARGVSPGELLRGSFLNSTALTPAAAPSVSVLDTASIAALNRVGANLNQLARRANAGDLLQPGELPEVLESLSQNLARIERLVFAGIDP
jgi:hypothetical protein